MNTDRPAPILQTIHTVGIVGVGLIGGSIAAALKQRNFPGQIIGIGRNPTRLQSAQNAGLIDNYSTEIAKAAANCDFIIFCTPVDQIVAGVIQAAANCPAGALLTDAGSVKATICQALQGKLPDSVTFIGSHPLAGSEKGGFEHADADLYVNRVCVITPDLETAPNQIDRVTQFWEALGMNVVTMTATDHDIALAQTSHVPHVVAAALAAALAAENRNLAATGFADTTRIAAGDPELWTEILLANADAVAASLSDFTTHLDEFRTAIANRNAGVLKKLLEVAKRNRDELD